MLWGPSVGLGELCKNALDMEMRSLLFVFSIFWCLLRTLVPPALLLPAHKNNIKMLFLFLLVCVVANLLTSQQLNYYM